jgi:uncharacterized protein YbgA (DUF1722 family)/uncharacterized protein YbbK (DUF523 family)
MKKKKSSRPIIIVSKCLGFEHCRYNGEIINDEFAGRMADHVDYRPVCPEVEIGLGVPRDPIHIVSKRGALSLVQPATGRDVTGLMLDFCRDFLGSLGEVDGFLLKFRSPSCGTNDVKIYASNASSGAMGKGSGFFGNAVLESFPDLAVETEGRLKNFRLREHYLTRIFTMARWRETAEAGRMKDLIDFHSRHKFLLMAYNQAELKKLGAIAANQDHSNVGEVFGLYRQHLSRALSRMPRYTSNINVLMHALGYFTKGLSAKEKSYFLDTLQRYRDRAIPMSVPTSIMNSWIIRFDQDYLDQQVFFRPYPEELNLISDSGKGRDL